MIFARAGGHRNEVLSVVSMAGRHEFYYQCYMILLFEGTSPRSNCNVHADLSGDEFSNKIYTFVAIGFSSFRCISYCKLWHGQHGQDLVYERVLDLC